MGLYNKPRQGPGMVIENKDLPCGGGAGILPAFRSKRPDSRSYFMANSAQAKKRARQAAHQRTHNMAQRSAYRTAVKKVRKAIEAGDKAARQAALNDNMSVMDSLADKNIVHKNKAARQKSRLSAAIKSMA